MKSEFVVLLFGVIALACFGPFLVLFVHRMFWAHNTKARHLKKGEVTPSK